MNDHTQNATSMNILVVDDDANIRKTLSYCLAAEGYTVIAVSNPADAIVEAMRRGATDYIAKPFTPDQVRILTKRIGRIRELEIQVAALKEDMQRLGPEAQL